MLVVLVLHVCLAVHVLHVCMSCMFACLACLHALQVKCVACLFCLKISFNFNAIQNLNVQKEKCNFMSRKFGIVNSQGW